MSLHLLLPLAIIPAILLGQLGRRAGLPAVVGQILAGVLLGPMVLGLIQPGEAHGDNGNGGSNGFFELAEIGLCVLLFKIGLETRLQHFTRVWRPALAVAAAGMILPFGLGLGIGLLIQWPFPAALFLGAALTATSIGVTAAVIEELGVRDSPEARIIMGAAVMDDVLGLLLLSVITALTAQTESIGPALGRSLFQAVLFLGAAVALGPHVVRLFDKLTDWLRGEVVLVALAFGYLLVMAHLAERVGLAAIIGSYAAGLVFSKRDEAALEKAFEPLTDLLTPIFFVLIGSSIAFDGGMGWAEFGVVVLLVGIAVGSKIAAPWLAPGGGLNRAAIGSGMVPRGEVGLVFAQVGLTTLALTQSQFSVLTLVLVATTLAGPMLFRRFALKLTQNSEGLSGA
tara:strand:- start:974 stop:2167 length:1194 start_codon:yes stop_codon:yes gene_type:complete